MVQPFDGTGIAACGAVDVNGCLEWKQWKGMGICR